MAITTKTLIMPSFLRYTTNNLKIATKTLLYRFQMPKKASLVSVLFSSRKIIVTKSRPKRRPCNLLRMVKHKTSFRPTLGQIYDQNSKPLLKLTVAKKLRQIELRALFLSKNRSISQIEMNIKTKKAQSARLIFQRSLGPGLTTQTPSKKWSRTKTLARKLFLTRTYIIQRAIHKRTPSKI